RGLRAVPRLPGDVSQGPRARRRRRAGRDARGDAGAAAPVPGRHIIPIDVDQTERYRALLEINNALISNLDRDALFHPIADALRPVVPFDRASIFLHDADRDVLRISILESSAATAHWLPLGTEVSTTDSHAGWVFRTREPLVRQDLAEGVRFPIEER